MSEDIIRRIRELEQKIKEQQEKIDYVQTILRLIQEEHPELTHSELLQLPDYRRSWYAYMGLRRWLLTYQRELERLREIVPPYTHKRIRMTFSIETGKGHEPFLAEVTCDTVIPRDMDEEHVIERTVNAAVKYFWILFDTWKDVTKDMQVFWGKETYSWIVRRAKFFQKYAREIQEEAMDEFLMKLMELGGLSRPPDEYVTTEAILSIGVETPIPEDRRAEPKFPKVHVFIDKKRKYAFRKEVNIIISEEKKFDILKKLGMELEI